MTKRLTVGELISELEKFPGNAEVYVEDKSQDPQIIVGISYDADDDYEGFGRGAYNEVVLVTHDTQVHEDYFDVWLGRECEWVNTKDSIIVFDDNGNEYPHKLNEKTMEWEDEI